MSAVCFFCLAYFLDGLWLRRLPRFHLRSVAWAQQETALPCPAENTPPAAKSLRAVSLLFCPDLCVRRSAESGCWRAYARQQRILTSRRRHLKPHMHGRSSHTHGPMTLQVRCRCHHGFTMRAQWLPRPRGKAPTRHMNHATNNRRGVCIAPSLRTPNTASCAERGDKCRPCLGHADPRIPLPAASWPTRTASFCVTKDSAPPPSSSGESSAGFTDDKGGTCDAG